MPVSSYPRVTVQGTGNGQNPQNGQALMIYNTTTGKYEAATSSTFSGGGGDATAANQTTQIGLATAGNANTSSIDTKLTTTNGNLNSIISNTNTTNQYLFDSNGNKTAAELLAAINTVIKDCKDLLTDIKNNQTNRTQKVTLTDGTTDNTFNGTSVEVHKTN